MSGWGRPIQSHCVGDDARRKVTEAEESLDAVWARSPEEAKVRVARMAKRRTRTMGIPHRPNSWLPQNMAASSLDE